RPAAEVALHEQHRRPTEPRIVERMDATRPTRLSRLFPVVLEDELLQTIEGDCTEIARRDDAIGVDIVAPQRKRPSLDRGHANGAVHQFTAPRTSTTSPAIAAAATIAGLMSSVRPVGLPCRPLKLRLDEDAQTCRPESLSGFIPRHIEQPASRQSNPAWQ